MAKSSFKFELKGIDRMVATIDKASAKGQQLVALVEAAAYDMNDDAISNIQSNGAVDLGAGGGLLSHQAVIPVDDYTWKVSNSSKHAPFIEWGTGKRAKVESEWQQYAAQYKGPYPGTWDEFEQNIKAWMKRQGIAEQKVSTDADGSEVHINVTYSIMMAILNNGLKARPFLYPAFVKNRRELRKRVKELLNQ
jgi:hypothetical protein